MLRDLFASDFTPYGMLVVDAKAEIVLANEAAERVFGYEPGALIGRSIDALVPDRFLANHKAARMRFLEEPRIAYLGAGRDLRGLRADGEEIAVEIGLNPLRTRDGLFVLTSVLDITARKESEEALREQTEALARSNAELDRFAYVISHDLKAPLRGISSIASWLLEDCKATLSEEAREYLRLLEQRARTMGQMIDGVLTYSRIGRSGSPSPVDAGAVAQDAIELVAGPESVRVRIEGTLPVVHYDRTQLQQVFQNLIGNAIHHLGKPAGEVVVSCRERQGDFEFSVRDDGAGIPERQFERIFEMFQTLNPKKENTGIGLPIVKKIVEMHGGSVSVESTVGVGSTFRFSVPRHPRFTPPVRPPQQADASRTSV